MSALPPIADMCSATRHVRFVPIANSCTAQTAPLFDDLVGASKQRGFDHGRFSGSATGQTFAFNKLTNSPTLIMRVSSRAPHRTSHQKLAFNFLGHGQSLPARSLVSRRGIAEETVHDTGLCGIQRNPILGGILQR